MINYNRKLPTKNQIYRWNRKNKRTVKYICKSQFMFWLILTLVFLNTVVLATEHHGQPEWLDEFQEYTNLVFVCLFTFEMLLKMYALSFTGYMGSLFNRFDFFVVISSILEYLLVKNDLIPPIGLSVLRCIRLLRGFKVTKWVTKSVNELELSKFILYLDTGLPWVILSSLWWTLLPLLLLCWSCFVSSFSSLLFWECSSLEENLWMMNQEQHLTVSFRPVLLCSRWQWIE